MRFIFLSLILLSAKEVSASSLTQLQAQVAARATYQQCVNNALNGIGGCGSFDCTGANQAFDHVKNSHCVIPVNAGCRLFGWGAKTKEEWIALGAKKMAIVGSAGAGATTQTCTGSMITADENAQKMEGVTDHGETDPTAEGGGGAIDGGSAFGLAEGEMLNRMRNGESLHDILAGSEYFQGLDGAERDSLLAAVDDPDSVLAGTDMNEEIAYDEKGGSSNPAAGAAKPGGLDSLLADKDKNKDQDKDKNKDKKDGAAGEGEDGKNGRNLASQDGKNGKRRYTSLERTIFDIVHAKYVKKMPDIVDIDQFIKKKAREKVLDIEAKFEGNQKNI